MKISARTIERSVIVRHCEECGTHAPRLQLEMQLIVDGVDQPPLTPGCCLNCEYGITDEFTMEELAHAFHNS